jgi:hypothetical protein
MIHDSCLMSAEAEYLSARAAADNDPDLLRTAAQLRAGARQSERDAMAIARLEAESRREVSKAAAADEARSLFARPPAPPPPTPRSSTDE